MTRHSLPSFSATMSKPQLLAALNKLAAEVTRMSSISVAAPLVKRGEQIAINDTQWRRIPARLTSVATVSGQNRYGFTEQIYSPTTGVYADNAYGLIGDGVNFYATELNNQLLTVPLSPPYQYAWLRYKGQVGISPVYEFAQNPSGSVSIVHGTIGSSYTLSGTALQDTGFNITLPPGDYLLLAQVTGQLNTNSGGAYCYLEAELQITSGTGTLTPTSGSPCYVVFTPGPNSGAGTTPTIFNWGTAPIVAELNASTTVVVTIKVAVPITTSYVAAVVWGTGGGAGQTSLVALQL